MYALDMASLNLQVGSTETDFVLVIVSRKGVDQVLNGKTKLGSNVVAAAGPTGARAASYYKVERNTDILIYSRLRGPSAGVSMARASMDDDEGANNAIYGKGKGAKDIVQGNQAIVPAAKPLVDLLDKESPMRH
jgi:lipid-binding SYLF domain-containing protein